MKTVAYLRVSTGSQDLATQKLAILDFTQKRRFTVDAFIESRISSRKSPIERRIEEMLGTLQSGDRLLVSELSRLGPQPLSGYWARKSRRPQLPRSWTSPVPPSTTSSRRARSGQADEKARLGQPRPYVVFQHQSGRYPPMTPAPERLQSLATTNRLLTATTNTAPPTKSTRFAMIRDAHSPM